MTRSAPLPLPQALTALERPGGLGLFLVVILAVGAVLLTSRQSEAERTAARFAAAWERSDYRAMHARLAPQSRREVSAAELARRYERAADPATATAVDFAEPEDAEGGGADPRHGRAEPADFWQVGPLETFTAPPPAL